MRILLLALTLGLSACSHVSPVVTPIPAPTVEPTVVVTPQPIAPTKEEPDDNRFPGKINYTRFGTPFGYIEYCKRYQKAKECGGSE